MSSEVGLKEFARFYFFQYLVRTMWVAGVFYELLCWYMFLFCWKLHT